MPQLDKVAFISSIVWLLIVYFGFYIVCVRYILPRILSGLRVRRSKLSGLVVREKELSEMRSGILGERGSLLLMCAKSVENMLKEVKERMKGFEKISSIYYYKKELFNDVRKKYSEMYVRVKIREKVMEGYDKRSIK